MRVARGVRVEERSALLQKVIEFSLLVAGAERLTCEAARVAANPEDDFGDLVQGDLFPGPKLLLLIANLVSK
jgi:hypothetical protein